MSLDGTHGPHRVIFVCKLHDPVFHFLHINSKICVIFNLKPLVVYVLIENYRLFPELIRNASLQRIVHPVFQRNDLFALARILRGIIGALLVQIHSSDTAFYGTLYELFRLFLL